MRWFDDGRKFTKNSVVETPAGQTQLESVGCIEVLDDKCGGDNGRVTFGLPTVSYRLVTTLPVNSAGTALVRANLN